MMGEYQYSFMIILFNIILMFYKIMTNDYIFLFNSLEDYLHNELARYLMMTAWLQTTLTSAVPRFAPATERAILRRPRSHLRAQPGGPLRRGEAKARQINMRRHPFSLSPVVYSSTKHRSHHIARNSSRQARCYSSSSSSSSPHLPLNFINGVRNWFPYTPFCCLLPGA